MKMKRQPAYEKIRRGLSEQIGSGRIAAGERLPSERELAAKHGVSLMTARHALSALEREGAVTRRVGSGTFAAPMTEGLRLADIPELVPSAVAGITEGGAIEWRDERGWLATESSDNPAGEAGLLIATLLARGSKGLFSIDTFDPVLAGGEAAIEVCQKIYDEAQTLLATRRITYFGGRLPLSTLRRR